MFDYKHYVPILRWKRAEWAALGALRASHRLCVTPLVEITPRSVAPRKSRPSIDEMLCKNVVDMQENWSALPVFVDVLHLNPSVRTRDGSHPLLFLGQEAQRRGVTMIPVTGPYRSSDLQNAVAGLTAADRRGVCIRVFRSDIRDSTAQDLMLLLSTLGLSARDADLVLDYQVTPSDPAEVDYRAICSVIPELAHWRTVTVVSGAFPRDLTRFSIGQHDLPRRDWQAWLRAVINNANLRRRAAFGDYTIQHAVYGEPPDFPNFSASIRYTAEDYWVIMRGEGVFNDDGPGFQQWPANAQLLCGRPEFRGPQFSEGDAYIHQMSLQADRTGGAETWLRAGINHHLTYVAGQIASLGGT